MELFDLGKRILEAQDFSRHMGAQLSRFAPGCAVLELEIASHHLQQQGLVHGGVISYLVDNALTFAAGSIAGEHVVTSEFKINYLKPARSGRLVATATVEGNGARLVVCRCQVELHGSGGSTLVALGQGTIAVQAPQSSPG